MALVCTTNVSMFIMQKKRYLKRQDAHMNTNKASLTSLTFEQAFEQYGEYKKSCNVRSRTLDTYNDSIKFFIISFVKFKC